MDCAELSDRKYLGFEEFVQRKTAQTRRRDGIAQRHRERKLATRVRISHACRPGLCGAQLSAVATISLQRGPTRRASGARLSKLAGPSRSQRIYDRQKRSVRFEHLQMVQRRFRKIRRRESDHREVRAGASEETFGKTRL